MAEKKLLYKVCCENGGEDFCVYRGLTQEHITRWLDIVLENATKGRFQLMSELNSLQSDDEGNTVFEDKFKMPLKLVNLALQPYGFTIKTAVEAF